MQKLKFQLNRNFINHFKRDWNLCGYEGRLHDAFNNITTIYWMKTSKKEDDTGDFAYMIMGTDIPYTDIPKFNTVFPFVKRKRDW